MPNIGMGWSLPTSFRNFEIAKSALAGAIDREESQAGDGHAGEVPVGVAEQFPGPLGCRIGRDGVIDRIVFGERYLGIVAVDRGTGCEHESRAAGSLGGAEEGDGAVDIHFAIKPGILDARPNARHRGDVHDGIWPMRSNSIHHGSIADVPLDDLACLVLAQAFGGLV